MKPMMWWEAYGTDDELRFFVGTDKNSGLVRSDKDFRSVADLAREAGLTRRQVRQIAEKFVGLGVVVASPSRKGSYAYWERACPDWRRGK